MSAPVAFIVAPGVLTRLTRASDDVESATTDSLQKAECVVPNARQDYVKKPVIPYLRKRAHSTTRIAARSQMRETRVKVPYISKINRAPVAAPRAAGSLGRGANLGGLSEEQIAATGAGLGGSAGEVLGAGRLSAE